jgi:hypothetical protein
MDQFIHDQNLAHYRKVLSESTDLTKRETVLNLLAQEQASFRFPTESKIHILDVAAGSIGWRE